MDHVSVDREGGYVMGIARTVLAGLQPGAGWHG